MSASVWRSGEPPLLAWYGDDFTGAAAVLEVLAFAGLPGALFLRRPDPAQRAALGDLAVIGLAGTARAESPEWMDENLPPVYDWLAANGAALVHYKVCSTLDSSPAVGSIGRAAELGRRRLGGGAIPCLVAAPWMGRYQCFGQLFARGPDGEVHRLDRHPVMARHPVTPMDEADVAAHIARQGTLVTAALTLDVPPGRLAARFDELAAGGADIVCLDADRDADLAPLGELMWTHRARSPLVLGSQGVEQALVDHWRASGALPAEHARPTLPEAPTIALSGSVSETTARQIARAAEDGWHTQRLDIAALVRAPTLERETLGAAVELARRALDAGAAPLFYTASGPDDPAVAELDVLSVASGRPREALQRRLGDALGELLQTLLMETGVRRAVVAGGDSSGRSLEALEAIALQALAPVSAGLSLYRLVADGELDGLEIALKGGQMGEEGCFEAVRRGCGAS